MYKMKKTLLLTIMVIILVGIILAYVLLIGRGNRSRLTYEQYNALSAEEQEEYFNSFDTIDDFFAWYNQAKQEYEDSQEYIEIGDGSDITIGEPGNNE